ncbi:MAG: hypothetical protein CM15mP23_10010 [Cryomorphaceae bacterium]|nr:MAG: hypothetical protein CM15mP23_10010 [Cryomorphaceae bacterium]
MHLANSDDGSCDVEGCTNSNYVEYDINANMMMEVVW